MEDLIHLEKESKLSVLRLDGSFMFIIERSRKVMKIVRLELISAQWLAKSL